MEEILRIDDPFVVNRRVTTEPVTVGGRRFAAGDRVAWATGSASYAERVRVPEALAVAVPDGVGLDVTAEHLPGHRGVTTMGDRAAAAGGTCSVLPGADGGTEVTVRARLEE